MKNIIKAAIVAATLISSIASAASWRIVEEKSFKGDKEPPMYILEQGRDKLVIVKSEGRYGNWKVVFDNPEVKNAMKGIKVDGEYIECIGGTFGDGFVWVEGCLAEDSSTYQKILNAKKIEINIDYYRKGQRVTTFTVNKPVEFKQ